MAFDKDVIGRWIAVNFIYFKIPKFSLRLSELTKLKLVAQNIAEHVYVCHNKIIIISIRVPCEALAKCVSHYIREWWMALNENESGNFHNWIRVFGERENVSNAYNLLLSLSRSSSSIVDVQWISYLTLMTWHRQRFLSDTLQIQAHIFIVFVLFALWKWHK